MHATTLGIYLRQVMTVVNHSPKISNHRDMAKVFNESLMFFEDAVTRENPIPSPWVFHQSSRPVSLFRLNLRKKWLQEEIGKLTKIENKYKRQVAFRNSLFWNSAFVLMAG